MSKESLNDAIEILDNRSLANKNEQVQASNQRRNIVVDNFGNEFQRQGDATHPAKFYISISGDMGYLERYQFKVVIDPFRQNLGLDGRTDSQQLSIANRNLTIVGDVIQPNPHDHGINNNPHSHGIDAGITLTDSTATEFEIWIEGINVTDYLKAQWNGEWITGQGVYPNGDDTLDAYDLLEIEGLLPLYDGSQNIYTSGYKTFEVRGNGTFNCIVYVYLKYSFTNE